MGIRDQILAHYAAGTLLELIKMCELQDRGEPAGEVLRSELIALHNSGAIDVLQPARTIADWTIDQMTFFMVQSVFVDIIPELETPVPAMLAAVKALVARGGKDLAAGFPNSAFRTWAEQRTRALETLNMIDPHDVEDAPYVFSALQALAKSDARCALERAISYITGGASPARAAAANAIGGMELTDIEAQNRVMHAFNAALLDSPDDNLRGYIVKAAVETAIKASELETSVVNLVNLAAAEASDTAIHIASSTFALHARELSPALVAAMTAIAHKIRVENKGTLDQIDHAAQALIRANRIPEALALLAPILVANGELASIDSFKSFAHAALGLDSARLGSIIFDWLLSLDLNLGEAARGLVGRYHGTNPLVIEFDASLLGLSSAEKILLAHRVIGYLFFHPVTAASLVLSLIRCSDPEAQKAMSEILFDPLLINFSGTLAGWLSGKANDETDPAKLVLDSLLARLESYLQKLRRIDRIKELGPSERERLIENHRQQESMRSAYAAVERNSIFSSISTRVSVLYGNRSISYFDGPDNINQRHEMKLQSFSHSVEPPRLSILDPFDLDYKIRVFRTMREAK